MATKTLTITEDAYNLLADRKMENESFSKEITRILSEKKKKRLVDFAGILSEEEGEMLLNDLNMFKERNIKLQNERFKKMWS